MTASTKIHSQTQMLHTCRMVVDSNSHHSMLNMHTLPDSPDSLISEALIPQVRTIATLIAAERHDFNQSSPSVFTDEADFFAARYFGFGRTPFPFGYYPAAYAQNRQQTRRSFRQTPSHALLSR